MLAQLREKRCRRRRSSAALGNNDGDCGVYSLDPHSDFLADAGVSVAAGFPIAARNEIQQTFSAGGYYSALLPPRLGTHTRLLVLNDVFMSKNYIACSGKLRTPSAGECGQTAWLKPATRATRRLRKEKVWVMGHIPPGIDPYTTARNFRNICRGDAPETFLASDDLGQYAGRIRRRDPACDLRPHHDMDEMRL